MKFYQNNKLVATLEKTGACLGESEITNKIEVLRTWELKDGRENLIDSFQEELEQQRIVLDIKE